MLVNLSFFNFKDEKLEWSRNAVSDHYPTPVQNEMCEMCIFKN